MSTKAPSTEIAVEEKPEPTLEQKLNTFAEALVDTSMASGSDLGSKESVDVFKAVTAWYLGTKKLKKGETDDDPAGTFDEIRQRVNGRGMTQ